MELAIGSSIRGPGPHVCKEFWTPTVGEQLPCQLEEGNLHYLYVVAVKTDIFGTAQLHAK